MRIKITKSLVLNAQIHNTPDGKIEVVNTKSIKALFSFSQFREKVSQGDFVVMEA